MSENPGQYPPKRVLEHNESLRRYELSHAKVRYAGIAILVASSAIPLWLIYLSIDAIAGKETNFSLSISVIAAFTVGGSLFTALISWLKYRSQKDELIRCRGRIKSLEEELEKLNSNDRGKS